MNELEIFFLYQYKLLIHLNGFNAPTQIKSVDGSPYVLLNNNVLVLKFNNYGILEEKLFYDKNKMNEYKFAEAKTENEVKRGSFLQSFLTSLRNKMYSNAGKK